MDTTWRPVWSQSSQHECYRTFRLVRLCHASSLHMTWDRKNARDSHLVYQCNARKSFHPISSHTRWWRWWCETRSSSCSFCCGVSSFLNLEAGMGGGKGYCKGRKRGDGRGWEGRERGRAGGRGGRERTPAPQHTSTSIAAQLRPCPHLCTSVSRHWCQMTGRSLESSLNRKK